MFAIVPVADRLLTAVRVSPEGTKVLITLESRYRVWTTRKPAVGGRLPSTCCRYSNEFCETMSSVSGIFKKGCHHLAIMSTRSSSKELPVLFHPVVGKVWLAKKTLESV